MGRRGPPPLPTAVKKQRGTLQKCRELPAGAEMAPPKAMPVMPKWLDAEAKLEWKRVVPQLVALGVLADIDGSMLADYCASHSLAVKAAKKYQREGLSIQTPFGMQTHPMVKVAREARAQARLLAAEFGMSPSSRSRVKAPEKPPPEKPAADETPIFGTPLRAVPTGG